MRIEVDFNVCADHGQCAIAAPDIFRIDDDGHLVFDAAPGRRAPRRRRGRRRRLP